MFIKNDEINKFLDARGKVILNACPGSGKTTSIAYKLQTLTEEIVKNNNKYSGVACLSFTNIAKDEINQKYKLFTSSFLHYPHLVSTIDSFINQYIVLPNYHLLFPKIKRPSILNRTNDLDDFDLFFLNKFRIDRKLIKFIYPPSTIQITVANSFLTNGHKPNLSKKDLDIFYEYCKRLKKWQFNNGLLSNNDASYIAFIILSKYPEVGKVLIKRFPLFVVDEAQDTSEIHFSILDRLIELGLSDIEIVGDPYQSLYEWREARPDLFMDRYNDKNWNSFDYTFCMRSNQNIINIYSILRGDEKSINSTLSDEINAIKIIKYEVSKEINAVKKFIELTYSFKKNQIVVRGRSLLKNLLGFNNIKNYWKTDIPLLLISAKQDLFNNEIKSAVNRIRRLIPLIKQPDLEYEYRIKIEKELKKDFTLNSQIINLLNNLPSFDLSLREWSEKTEDLIKTFFNLESKFEFQLKQRQGDAIYKSSINDLFNIIKNVNNFPITTIHQVKGKTFDTLLLFLSDNSSGQNISLNDYSKPSTFPKDKKRMLYVAMSRPKYLLALAVPKDTSSDELIENFGKDIEIIEV